jgi:hypothetical protein
MQQRSPERRKSRWIFGRQKTSNALCEAEQFDVKHFGPRQMDRNFRLMH